MGPHHQTGASAIGDAAYEAYLSVGVVLDREPGREHEVARPRLHLGRLHHPDPLDRPVQPLGAGDQLGGRERTEPHRLADGGPRLGELLRRLLGRHSALIMCVRGGQALRRRCCGGSTRPVSTQRVILEHDPRRRARMRAPRVIGADAASHLALRLFAVASAAGRRAHRSRDAAREHDRLRGDRSRWRRSPARRTPPPPRPSPRAHSRVGGGRSSAGGPQPPSPPGHSRLGGGCSSSGGPSTSPRSARAGPAAGRRRGACSRPQSRCRRACAF